MAKQSVSTNKMISIALIIVGAGLVYWGYQSSGSIGSQLSQTFTGSHSDKVMMLYIGGAASLVVGLYLFFKK
ncbi:DUF3185 family protein [Aliikangiella coralliicola]|uniref:DUF3185 family protein n=1 Tax=Aliikangiella coralliicola TaxID=2592383 RepID=A0A545UG51_9GAMM|nr:DUF3185 family protein [Aliikangiella coralliicola]TQV88448.1 DUF3185 family protein [Aliikangiella coralliicola]